MSVVGMHFSLSKRGTLQAKQIHKNEIDKHRRLNVPPRFSLFLLLFYMLLLLRVNALEYGCVLPLVTFSELVWTYFLLFNYIFFFCWALYKIYPIQHICTRKAHEVIHNLYTQYIQLIEHKCIFRADIS